MQDVLDVGSGIGHWGQLLANILPSSARVQGVDRDPLSVEKAAARAAAHSLADRFTYKVAVAEKLPFADSCFDLVTCQTVLIHASDPGAVVDEMIRVARPGGLILAAEPNNIARALMLDSVRLQDPVDEILTRVRFQLICERGKAALGEGNNSIGDLLPACSPSETSSTYTSVLTTKRTSYCRPTTPPLSARYRRALRLQASRLLIWSHKDTRRFFLAGVVVRANSTPCGQLPLMAVTNSTRQSPTGHTLGRERVSVTLSPAESQNRTRRKITPDCKQLEVEVMESWRHSWRVAERGPDVCFGS